MDFRVLGPVEVRAADGPREVHGRKELAGRARERGADVVGAKTLLEQLG